MADRKVRKPVGVVGAFILAVLAILCTPAAGQNIICPTAPLNDATNKCASTAFVQNQLAVGTPIAVGTTAITGGTSGRVLYDNAGVVGEYTQSQLTAQINVATSLLSGALPAWPNNTTTFFRGDGTYATLNCAAVTDAGTVCTLNTGTSGGTVPTNSGGFTQSGPVNFTSTFAISGATETFPASGVLVGTTDSQTLTNKTIAIASNTLTGVAPLASPTFSGTVTMPDAKTWTASGITGPAINNAIIGGTTPAAATVTSLTATGNTSLQGTVTGTALSTVGTVGGSLCATSGGLFLYESGVNCFAASAASITVGTTTVASGTNTRVLFDNSGVLGEYVISGSGNVCMSTSCVMTTPNLGTPSAATLTNATGLPVSSGVSGLGTGVATALAVNTGSAGAFGVLIASGAKALATGAISSGACTTAQTDTATGVATTDAIMAAFSGDPTATTGYIPSTSGMLTIIVYPTANTVNFKVCNNTGSSITPGAVTINWRVVR